MGLLRFRLNESAETPRPDWLRRGYVTGPDWTPYRGHVDLRAGMLTCQRSSPESGRFHVPWPIDGVGTPFVATATLCERAEAFDLEVELARGKLNDVRNQAADWELLGLEIPRVVREQLHRALRAFAQATTAREQEAERHAACKNSLAASAIAARHLIESYSDQVLRKRRDGTGRLTTQLGVALAPGEPKSMPRSDSMVEACNSVRMRCAWARVLPVEGRHRWDESDAQLQWCRKRRIVPAIGPLVEFRPSELPDWIWLFQGDLEQIQSQAVEFVRHAVSRYRGKVSAWHVAHRLGEHEILGLTEDEQIRLLVRLLQEARKLDPETPLVVDLDRPWAEWMSAGRFQLGPLHLADTLARADLGLAGLGLEIAPGWKPFGSHLRDAFDLSRLLDLYSLVNLPLYLSITIPSSLAEDDAATDGATVDPEQWPADWNAEGQRDLGANWLSLAVAKPFVRSVVWSVATDAHPGPFPHGGLVTRAGAEKPLLDWMRGFRKTFLA